MEKYEKVFESEKIIYIKLSKDLADDYLIMVNDPEVMRLIRRDDKIFSYDEEVEWINGELEKGAHVYSMIEKETGDFIGNVEITTKKDGLGELGIVVTPKKQDVHFGTEALHAIVEYAQENLDCNELELKVHADNARAIHCYEKIGFVKDGTEENGDIHMSMKL